MPLVIGAVLAASWLLLLIAFRSLVLPFEALFMNLLTSGAAFGGAGLVDLIREHSHTCYLGQRGARHDWGYGCGECPACSLRAKGWREYVALESQRPA